MYITQQVPLPPVWLAIPFVALLLMIATGPLFFPHFWHRNYPKIALMLATLVMGYYMLVLDNTIKPVEAVAEYVQFITVIVALYMATGGIAITVHAQGTPFVNTMFLLSGAIMANLIGTTGASMLLLRAYLQLNKGRIRAYHIVFFIFIVSNVGGALTPIGDPPLFLGFLKGIPFAWAAKHNLLPWTTALLVLLGLFYRIDARNQNQFVAPKDKKRQSDFGIVSVRGSQNFLWIATIIAAIFLDPNVWSWVPSINYHGHSISFVRELILLMVAIFSRFTTDQESLRLNRFSLEPLREVCLIFIGIFGTMIPALELIGGFAQSDMGKQLLSPSTLYWGTGLFSSFLDNAPTYLNFATASMASQGASIALVSNVQAYAAGGVYPHSVLCLKAISVASVFFGAMTYIGNGPNFMVKAIAEQEGISMPSFGKYILRFSVPLLLPVLLLVWMLFFCGTT
ncbi:MAG TPA: sodium:proton antiporter [Amoebophilaceae bacterium]|jgi:Na+/H+ antiporter NhaD/arsenite permease-like protein|nr:sodium:proton antiporter [Amoebophilaceae bacterium]